MQIQIDIPPAKRQYVSEMLRDVKGGMDNAMVSALTRTLSTVRTDLDRELRGEVNLMKAIVMDHIAITGKPTKDNPTGQIKVSHKLLKLAAFKPKYPKKRGVSVTTLKKKGRQYFRHGFKATVIGGLGGSHTGAFTRVKGRPKAVPMKGRYAGRRIKRGPRKGQLIKRQPIKEMFGISVAGVLTDTEGMLDRAVERAADTLQKRLLSQVDRILARRK